MVLSSPNGMSFPHSAPVGVCPSSQRRMRSSSQPAAPESGEALALAGEFFIPARTLIRRER